MKLKQFAAIAGCIITKNDANRGERYGYTSEDDPYSRVTGFKTESEAIAAWYVESFGKKAGAIIKQLLKGD